MSVGSGAPASLENSWSRTSGSGSNPSLSAKGGSFGAPACTTTDTSCVPIPESRGLGPTKLQSSSFAR